MFATTVIVSAGVGALVAWAVFKRTEARNGRDCDRDVDPMATTLAKYRALGMDAETQLIDRRLRREQWSRWSTSGASAKDELCDTP